MNPWSEPRNLQLPITARPLPETVSHTRLRTALSLTLIGEFVLIVGAKPGWFGWSHTSGVGFVKITVFLVGLGMMCAGGMVGLPPLWRGLERTIVSDIGMRLVATGYVVSVISGMADVLGFGSQPLPGTPFFGPVQSAGVVIGQAVIALGFLMMLPYAALFKKKNAAVESDSDGDDRIGKS